MQKRTTMKGAALKLILSFVLTMGLLPSLAYAGQESFDTESVSSDASLALSDGYIADWTTSGTCEWSIDADGNLVVRPANGAASGELERWCLWSSYRDQIKTATFEQGVSATSTDMMFYDCPKLSSVDLSGLDTSKVTDMSSMFNNCSSLRSLNLSSFDTSRVTDMSYMFDGCSKLSSLNLSSFDTANATNMHGMFADCYSLKSLNLSHFETLYVTDMSSMFSGCKSLTSLDLSGFNTTNAKYMSMMFHGCSKLLALDISSFDTSYATSMGSMFYRCDSLASIKLGNTFSFEGASLYRSGEFPTPSGDRYTGKWMSSADGKAYTPAEVPSNVAATYTAQTTSGIASTRLSGDSRYNTMAEISAAGFTTADSVVLASGENFPDALGASALAGALSAPVLLTDSDNLSDEASSEISRLGAETVYIVGGTAAVSVNVENALRADGCTVERVFGQSRQETAAQVADEVASLAAPDTAVVASGGAPWDSLSASPFAYAQNYPVYLTEGDGTLSEDTVGAIKANSSIKRVVIVGGDNAVKPAAESALRSAGFDVERWSGESRYDTSREIAKHAMAEGMSAGTVAVASGENFPDALAGGALVGSQSGVLLLSPSNDGTQASQWIGTHRGEIGTCYLLGGSSALSGIVAMQINAAL